MSSKDTRKLMQIGFAALLARKKAVQKQYAYEKRGDGGFVFEPILRGNAPELEDEEYMRKRYYSEMVFQGAQEAQLQTSIQEGDPNKKAARRFWAGREGTGWNGTGKGGYMASLQPGVPETLGTGLGSAMVESDHLMQAYMENQTKKMHILKGKSQQATADLFRRVTEQANRDSGVVDLSGKNYMPPARDLGIPFNTFYERYAREIDFGRDKLSDKEWAKKTKKDLSTINFKWDGEHFFAGTYGILQGLYARKLAEMRPDRFTGEWYRRLLASTYDLAGGEGFAPRAETMFPDFETKATFYDGTDMDHPGGQMYGPRSGRDANQMKVPTSENFSGDGGTLNVGHMEVATPKLLKTVFEKKSIDQMFPKAWQVYKRHSKMDPETVYGGTNNVQVRSALEAKQFIRWMVKSVNDELAKLNEIVPTSFTMKSQWPTKVEGMEALGKFQRWDEDKGAYVPAPFGSGYSETAKYLGGLEGYGRGGSGDWMSEVVQGFMSDFGVLNNEARYKMANEFGPIKGEDGVEWGWKNVDTAQRGVDIYVPQSGGLLRIHLNVRIVPEGPNNRPYAEVYIPFKSKKWGTPDGIQYIKDVPMSYQEFAVYTDQSMKQMAEHRELVKSFWRTGQLAQHMGQAMITSNGIGSRMFMGDMSPANSVGFFTSTISVGDFAERLKTFVDTGADYWWGEPDGFGGYFDLSSMEGGAFKEWALKWEQEAEQLQSQINEKITAKWKEWVSTYPKGGKTAFPPSLAKAWAAPIRLGPFVHSTKYLGHAQSAGKRPHGYYVQGDWEGGPLVG
tara:strand:- start:9265 stop:11631 length:2367 start_codon:yes stop_codon:yes gene_type:complete